MFRIPFYALRFPVIMIPNIIVTIFAYLLGSVSSGVIVSRFFARRDVRTVGSGHTGALNTFRAAGFAPALFAFVGDGAKAIVALYFARYVTQSDWGIALAGIAVVIGHCYPLYTRFHGGMGLATSGTILLALDAIALILLILIWFALKSLLKKSPLVSAIVALLLPFLLWLTNGNPAFIAFGIGTGAVIFTRHLGELKK